MDNIPTFQPITPSLLIQEIGERIRTHRLARGWTQAELAKRAGVSISTLKLFEREGKGSLQRLAKIAIVLHLDAELRSLFTSAPSYQSIDDIGAPPRRRGSSKSKS